MNLILLLLSLVMIACILCNKLTSKIGIPMLLAFLAVGMLCGVDGILHIRFDNYAMTETLCTVALIFITVVSAQSGALPNRLPENPCCCPRWACF